MKKLILLLSLIAGISPVMAADTNPPKAIPLKAATVVSTPSPFFVGINAGMGFMSQEAAFLTLPGEYAGSGRIYPTGGLLGVTAGVGNTFGGYYAEAFVRADYAFTRASGASLVNTFETQNSFDLQQGIFVGVPLGTLSGALPGLPSVVPAPSSWPIPVNVPANFSSAAFIIGPEFGVAERSIAVKTTSLIDGTGSTVSRWLYGPFVGVRAKYLVAQNWSLDIAYDHEFYGNSWTQSGGTFLLGQFKATNADSVRGGLTYHF
jgi:opacity protein-like surface antigen